MRFRLEGGPRVIWAALLAGIAGYVDVICFLRLGGAFAANMTGNLVAIGIEAAAGRWLRAAWIASLPVAFLLGVLAARLVLRAHRSTRFSLLIEAAVIALSASGLLGLAAVPLLSAAMAMQNEAVRHGVVAVNVGFVTGDIQQLGERLIAETVPGPQSKGGLQAPVILTILVCYAFGAAIGTLAAGWGAAALLGPAALLTGAVLLPERWTGLAAQRH
jgi:uncharacterized membrane protein YoaK (UPF0700 family)